MIEKELLTGLANNKRILRQLVSVAGDGAMRRRIKDYWTIYEHLDHLVVAQRMLLGRIRQFLEEERPVMRPYVPEAHPEVEGEDKSADELVDEFEALRDEEIRLIEGAGGEVWAKEAEHPEYRKYGFEILVRHILLHDGFHMWRMEELWIEREELIKELN